MKNKRSPKNYKIKPTNDAINIKIQNCIQGDEIPPNSSFLFLILF